MDKPPLSPYGAFIGISIDDFSEGKVTCSVALKDHHLNNDDKSTLDPTAISHRIGIVEFLIHFLLNLPNTQHLEGLLWVSVSLHPNNNHSKRDLIAKYRITDGGYHRTRNHHRYIRISNLVRRFTPNLANRLDI